MEMDLKSWKEAFDRGIIHTGNLARMDRVMKKAAAKGGIKISFIGGSITQGSAATAPEFTYVNRVFSWWKLKFPESNVEFINAGVGATNSKFGVARVYEDVLIHKPDVVFAEFSVNDNDNELFLETYEGMVRKILTDCSEPALFLFHNVFYDDGHNAEGVHNRIGKFYDLPIVSIKESIYAEIERGTILNSDISKDNLHPNDYGHKLVADCIINLLERIYDTVFSENYRGETYVVPENTVTENRYFGSVRRNNLNTEPELRGFTKDETEKLGSSDAFKNGWYAKAKGSSIHFEVVATMISVQYRKYAVHPAPIAAVIIDDDVNNADVLDANFEETWGDCLYLQDIVVDGAPGKHIVEIVVIEESQNKEFYLAALITA